MQQIHGFRIHPAFCQPDREEALGLLLERGSVYNCTPVFRFESFGQGCINFEAFVPFGREKIRYTCSVPVTHPMFQSETEQMYVRIEDVWDLIEYKIF